MDLTAEKSVLGCILQDGSVYFPIAEILETSDFQEIKHRIIFEAMGAVHQKGLGLDLVNLAQELKENGNLRKVGGRTYLTDLLLETALPSHATQYAQYVHDQSVRSKLFLLSQELGQKSKDESISLSKILKTVSSIASLTSSRVSEINPVTEYESWERMYSSGASRGILGLSTGIHSIDALTFGLIPTHTWVLGAYRANGKTFAGLNFANAILNQGKKAVILSLEMSRIEIVQRLIGLRAELDLIEVIGKEPERKTEAKMQAKEFIFGHLLAGTLAIYDNSMNVDDIYWILQREAIKGPISFVMLDYIQLIKGRVRDKHIDIAEAANMLPLMAKKHNFTWLILSQISNEAQRAGFEADIDGFKDAGEISANANVAIRLFREREQGSSRYTDDMKFSFKKIRHGVTGDLDLKIRFPGGKIYNPKSATLEDI